MYSKEHTVAAKNLIRKFENRKNNKDNDYIELFDEIDLGDAILDTIMCQVVNLGKPLLTRTDVSQSDPKSASYASVKGAFTVLSPNQDTNPFKSVNPATYKASVAANDALLLCMYSTNVGLGEQAAPFRISRGSGTYVTDAPWSDFNWAACMFTNIPLSSTTTDRPMINFKSVLGYEFAPHMRSVLSTQMTTPALYDPLALQSMTIIAQARQSFMPEEYNELGDTIAGLADQVIGQTPIAGLVKAIIPNKNEATRVAKAVDTEVEGRPTTSNQDSIPAPSVPAVTAPRNNRKQAPRRKPRVPQRKPVKRLNRSRNPVVVIRERSSAPIRRSFSKQPRRAALRRSNSTKSVKFQRRR